MAFLRASLGQEPSPVIRGRGLWLRPPQMSDYTAWAELRAASREHLAPWEPLWPRDELTRGGFRRRLRHYAREQREDLGYAFFILDDRTDVLFGGLTLSNVRRGVTQAASLGYWLGAPFTKHGLMSEAVRATLPFAFDGLKLHRIEAASMPANTGSIGVLLRNGFTREGYARRYLKINGRWEDHLLFAMNAEEWSAGEGRGA